MSVYSADETLFVWSLLSCHMVQLSKFCKMKLGIFFQICKWDFTLHNYCFADTLISTKLEIDT